MTACIFDLDGVIVDTAHYHFLAWKRLGGEFNYNFTIEENEQLKGVSRMESLDILLGLAGLTLTDEHKRVATDKKNAWFNDYISQMTPADIFPGVQELISALKVEGMKVGLASSSKNAKTVLRQLDIENQFDTVVDGNMIRHTKPDPEIFLMTARMLGVKPNACVVVEDAEAGVQAGIAAGMKCIGIGSADTLGRADRVFARTSDVTPAAIRALLTMVQL